MFGINEEVKMPKSNKVITIRCPECKIRPGKIGTYRGTPCENFEVGFWCRKCKKEILVSWYKSQSGMVMKQRDSHEIEDESTC